jgi:hypothetical protein
MKTREQILNSIKIIKNQEYLGIHTSLCYIFDIKNKYLIR